MATTRRQIDTALRDSSWSVPVPHSGERISRDEIDGLLALTDDPNPHVRGRVVKRLCPCHVQGDEERVWERLIAMVDDPDPYVRAQILHALADGSPRSREAQVVAVMEQMRNDPDHRLRRRVRRLLAQYRRTGRINVLWAPPSMPRPDGPRPHRFRAGRFRPGRC